MDNSIIEHSNSGQRASASNFLRALHAAFNEPEKPAISHEDSSKMQGNYLWVFLLTSPVILAFFYCRFCFDSL